METLNVTSLLIYEAKIHVSLTSVANVTSFSDQSIMLQKNRFHISYNVDSKFHSKNFIPIGCD